MTATQTKIKATHDAKALAIADGFHYMECGDGVYYMPTDNSGQRMYSAKRFYCTVAAWPTSPIGFSTIHQTGA